MSPATFIIAFTSSATKVAPASANSSWCSMMAFMNVPIRSSATPISVGAASTAIFANSAIEFPNASIRPLNPFSAMASFISSTMLVMTLTVSFIGSCTSSYRAIPTDSNALLQSVIAPCRLSFMVSAISLAAPSAS